MKTEKKLSNVQKKYRIFLVISFIFLLIVINIFLFISNDKNPKFTDGELKLVMIDVDNADAFLILQDDKAMLIDTGYLTTYSRIESTLRSNNVRKLDKVIITHPHRDHAGGFLQLRSRYQIDEILIGDYYKKLPKIMSIEEKIFYGIFAYSINLENIEKKNVKTISVNDIFYFADSKIEVLGPIKDYENVNNFSLVLKFTYEKKSILFTGDIEREAEKDLCEADVDISAEIVKLPHHGSKTSNTLGFLNKVNPEYVLISAHNGKFNHYGHPGIRAMTYLKKEEIPVYRTDELRTVSLTISKEDIQFYSEPGDYKSGTELLEEEKINQRGP